MSTTGFCLSPVCPEAGGQHTEREEDQGEESCQEGEAQRYNILYFLMDKSLAENQESVNQRRLNEKTGNCTLILYKTNGQRAVLNVYYAPFPLST